MQSRGEQDWRNQTYKFHPFHAEMVMGVIAIIISIFIGYALFQPDEGYWSNVYMTVIGVAITILVLNRQAEHREEQREERELKKQLIRDARSKVNNVARNAVHQIRERGWLDGDNGLLQNANLGWANLQGAGLALANLQGARLRSINLQEANLYGANLDQAELQVANLNRANLKEAILDGADLTWANLEHADLKLADLRESTIWQANLLGADLGGAQLQKASLWYSNLQGASFIHTNLQGADLSQANLQNAILASESLSAKFNENTILPDDCYWTPQTDMGRYTDPNHPKFWQAPKLDEERFRS